MHYFGKRTDNHYSAQKVTTSPIGKALVEFVMKRVNGAWNMFKFTDGWSPKFQSLTRISVDPLSARVWPSFHSPESVFLNTREASIKCLAETRMRYSFLVACFGSASCSDSGCFRFLLSALTLALVLSESCLSSSQTTNGASAFCSMIAAFPSRTIRVSRSSLVVISW